MLIAILVIVSFLTLICLVNTAIMLLMGSALVQLIEKSKAPVNSDKPQPEKPWYANM